MLSDPTAARYEGLPRALPAARLWLPMLFYYCCELDLLKSQTHLKISCQLWTHMQGWSPLLESQAESVWPSVL